VQRANGRHAEPAVTIVVRAGREDDLTEVAAMTDDFVQGHPAAQHAPVAGRPVREVVRGVPARELNRVAPRAR
jgi:hypothetical protein